MLSLLLCGGVVAASSGLAVHDPDCAHHAPATESHHGAMAHHGDHHQGSEQRTGHEPAPWDCDCAGFCAIAGAAAEAAPSGAVTGPIADPGIVPADLVATVVVLEPYRGLVLPPSTGPPASFAS